MAAIDLAQPDGHPLDTQLRTGRQVYRAAVARGALLRPLGDTMYLFPPLNTRGEDLRAMLAVLADSVDAVLR
jgi:adenosylmethionine-8-amino-7-oxononanoate aminotransferase